MREIDYTHKENINRATPEYLTRGGTTQALVEVVEGTGVAPLVRCGFTWARV